MSFLLMTVGSFYFWPRIFGSICNTISGFAGIASSSVVFEAIGRNFSDYCRKNVSNPTYSEDGQFTKDGSDYDYGDESDLLELCAIITMTVAFAQLFCCWIPAY